MDVAPYIIAPISSDEKWEQFVDTLETFCETSIESGAGIMERLFYDEDSSMPVQTMLHRKSML
jgi:hypothetical protein